MQFDLFHSLGRVDNVEPLVDDRIIYREFLNQVKHAENLGLDTIWVAESHFSSEVQKNNQDAVIVNYKGELGLNCDFGQLGHFIFNNTKKINFGTAIHNIVGGNGGPLASADRVRSLAFYNGLRDDPRKLFIGVASGRFPYINKPFGITPRDEVEKQLWPQYKRLIFLEAYEIFYRLCCGETLGSLDTRDYVIDRELFPNDELFDAVKEKVEGLRSNGQVLYNKRWQFDPLKIVPDLDQTDLSRLSFVLGSHDPLARKLAFDIGSPDIFNLSFTPPAQLNKVHEEMTGVCSGSDHPWHRGRLPRTVLVFIDKDQAKAVERAERCFDTYIDAMQGTVVMPPRSALMERALIGTPEKIYDDILDQERHGFQADDRIMLWFEFNQKDYKGILDQMTLFTEKVISRLV